MPPSQRIFWLLVLAFHATVAGGWLWFAPGGFPVLHPHFWSNRIVPVILLATVATAFVAARRGKTGLLGATFAAFPACWFAGALAGRIAFPVSLAWLFWVPLAGSVVMAALVRIGWRVEGVPRRQILSVLVLSALLGVSLPLSQKAPKADTRPLNPSEFVEFSNLGIMDRSFDGRLSAKASVHSGDGSLTIKAGRLTLSVQPLLRFLERSPDGCWTAFVPASVREGPELRLKSSRRDGRTVFLQYRADYEAVLRAWQDEASGPVRLESQARLARRIDSHLNSFCDLDISGHQRLSLEFSPCPGSLIEVRPADYPFGRPLRAAYLDRLGEFRVVEASNGEKGPFKVLAQGRLGRGEPLGITLYDKGIAMAKITLEDWSAQAGTALSATAGWGFPVNAIEFSLASDRPGSTAAIYTSLAGTSVGRGWDSVGHRAGTYRNRMTIESLDGSIVSK